MAGIDAWPVLSGCAMEIFGHGVLISGDPGIGKSDLLIELLNRGHVFIADDAVALNNRNGRLLAAAPPATAGIIALRGMGLIDLNRLFSPDHLKATTTVELQLALHKLGGQPQRESALLGTPQITYWQKVAVATINLPVTGQRPLATLAEICVKWFFDLNQQQKSGSN